MVRISLVIPVHNGARYLPACLDSVIAQTHTNWEAMCVDDGSTDGSGVLLAKYVDRDGRFRVLSVVHQGVSAARNAAIRACTGDYIGFLDADDRLDENWLRDVALTISGHPSDVVRLTTAPVLECGFSFLTFVRASLLKEMNEPFPVGMRLREDTIFLLRLMREAGSVHQTDLSGYRHLDHPDSVVHRPQSVGDLIRFIDEFIPYAGNVSLRQSSRAIYISTLWWRVQRDRSEDGADARVFAALDRAVSAGIFSYRYAPLLCGKSFVLADVYMGLRRGINSQWLP